MQDLILISRLDSLDQSLTQIVENSIWLRSCVLKPLAESEATRETWPEGIWDALDATVVTEARELRWRVQKIREKLQDASEQDAQEAAKTLSDAWKNYREIYELSKEAFDECLEYIGGLALRDRGFDRQICQIADKLILSCGTDWSNFRWPSLTILAAQERVGKTMASIIRLRFPEWTIWTLPFAASEFAHVALFESGQTMKDFVEMQIKNLMEKDPRLAESRNSEPQGSDNLKWAEKRAEKRAQNHIHQLIADIFATYTMGPAYACAAILLRFTPVDGGSESYDGPSDVKRAEVVLGTLKRMNQKATASPYADIIKRLEREWVSALTRASSVSTDRVVVSHPPLENSIDVPALINDTLRVFSNRARQTGPFPPSGNDGGWLKALDWQGRLMMKLKRNDPIYNWDGFNIAPTSRLRDALNAAWLCRMYVKPEDNIDIRRISEAAQGLCEKIKDAGKPPTNGSAVIPSLPGGAMPPAQEVFPK